MRPLHGCEQSLLVKALLTVVRRKDCRDSQALVQLLKSRWFGVQYLALLVLRECRPISGEVISAVCAKTEFREEVSPISSQAIRSAARATLASWREDDPAGYRLLTESLLN